MTYFERYITGWTDFLPSLNIFGKQTKKKLVKELKSQNDELNFLSKISEIRFGLFYAQHGAQLDYEKKYKLDHKLLTPDWTIHLNKQTIITEVVRLNPTLKDHKRNTFELDLINKIEQIKERYWLVLNFRKEYFDPLSFDHEEIVSSLRNWLSNKRKVGDQITLFDNFIFTIEKTNTTAEYVCIAGNTNQINIDTKRLEGNGITANKSEFYKKIDKYAELIKTEDIPFIVSLYVDFLSGIDEEHLRKFLYGSSIDDRVSHSIYTDLSSGLFYSDENAKDLLSGVLLRSNNQHMFFPNHSLSNKLNKENKKFFSNFAYQPE